MAWGAWVVAGLLVAAPASGCAVLYAGAAGTALLGPPIMPGLAGKEREDSAVEMGPAVVSDGVAADDSKVEGGGAFRIQSMGVRGDGRLVLVANGRGEVGTFGVDRVYGLTGADIGPGLRATRHLTFGATVGYSYGGYAQSAHEFPARLSMRYGNGGFAFRASPYGGWRIGEDATLPRATTTWGPGWDRWGLDAGVLGLSEGGKGLGLSLAVDHQDGLTVTSLALSATLGRPDE